MHEKAELQAQERQRDNPRQTNGGANQKEASTSEKMHHTGLLCYMQSGPKAKLDRHSSSYM